MCRNIRPLYNYAPPASSQEIHAAATQYVRKVSGMNTPSAKNKEAFDRAITEITSATERLLTDLRTSAPPKDREVEAMKAKARTARRFGQTATS